jgi:hypothetical protein
MTINFGDVPAGDTLPVPFASYDSNGASVTLTGLVVTDIEIYKDGSVTQRASDAGYTLLDTDGIDFDGVTGIHGFSIDLSDNTDAGFYAVGSRYFVVVSAVTIDAQTVNFIAATFRIVPAEASAGVPDVNVASIDANAITATSIAADAITAAKVAADVHAEAADANWDEAVAGHSTPGTFGQAYDSVSIGVFIADDAIGSDQLHSSAINEIVDATWDELQSAHGGAGTFGEIATEIAAILLDTAEIGAAGAGLTEAGGTGDHLTALATAANLATVDGIVDAILLDTAEIANLNDISAADVNAQMVDVMATDTHAQPGQESPAATTSYSLMLRYLYKMMRNRKEQTADTFSLYDDAGTTVDQKSAVSDDTSLAVRDELVTGP